MSSWPSSRLGAELATVNSKGERSVVRLAEWLLPLVPKMSSWPSSRLGAELATVNSKGERSVVRLAEWLLPLVPKMSSWTSSRLGAELATVNSKGERSVSDWLLPLVPKMCNIRHWCNWYVPTTFQWTRCSILYPTEMSTNLQVEIIVYLLKT
jgi:hypothetical protein